MSEEQHNEETEVEAHGSRVSGTRISANDEPRDEVEGDDEVEGHAHRASHPKYS